MGMVHLPVMLSSAGTVAKRPDGSWQLTVGLRVEQAPMHVAVPNNATPAVLGTFHVVLGLANAFHSLHLASSYLHVGGVTMALSRASP